MAFNYKKFGDNIRKRIKVLNKLGCWRLIKDLCDVAMAVDEDNSEYIDKEINYIWLGHDGGYSLTDTDLEIRDFVRKFFHK